jgi:hypothetical protein
MSEDELPPLRGELVEAADEVFEELDDRSSPAWRMRLSASYVACA